MADILQKEEHHEGISEGAKNVLHPFVLLPIRYGES